MIHTLPWIDLSIALQDHLLHQMAESFHHTWHPDLRKRFLRPSVRIQLYHDAEGRKGACLSWKNDASQVHYLDKLFVLPDQKGKGIGRMLLDTWAKESASKQETWIWRTDETLAHSYYGKHPHIQRIATIDTYVYMGIRSYHTTAWEAEDLLPFLYLPSAFARCSSNSAPKSEKNLK